MKLELMLLVLIISKITSNAQKFEGVIIVKTEASKYIANTSLIDKNVPPIIDTIRYYVKDEKFLKECLTMDITD